MLPEGVKRYLTNSSNSSSYYINWNFVTLKKDSLVDYVIFWVKEQRLVPSGYQIAFRLPRNAAGKKYKFPEDGKKFTDYYEVFQRPALNGVVDDIIYVEILKKPNTLERAATM